MGSWEHSSELVDHAIRQVFVRITLREVEEDKNSG